MKHNEFEKLMISMKNDERNAIQNAEEANLELSCRKKAYESKVRKMFDTYDIPEMEELFSKLSLKLGNAQWPHRFTPHEGVTREVVGKGVAVAFKDIGVNNFVLTGQCEYGKRLYSVVIKGKVVLRHGESDCEDKMTIYELLEAYDAYNIIMAEILKSFESMYYYLVDIANKARELTLYL